MITRCDLVLVGTSNPENLGSVARLLENFGAGALSLVAPRAAPDDHRALVVGRAALHRLAAARRVDTLAAAVVDAAYVVGFSARRGATRPTVGLRNLAALLADRAPAGRLALVFGPEDTGLVAADLDACDVLCAIETPGTLSSFNVAQAIGIALWELSRADNPHPTTPTPPPPPELETLLDHAFEALGAIGYLRNVDPAQKRVHLRRILASAALDSDEIRGLHGLCAQILRPR